MASVHEIQSSRFELVRSKPDDCFRPRCCLSEVTKPNVRELLWTASSGRSTETRKSGRMRLRRIRYGLGGDGLPAVSVLCVSEADTQLARRTWTEAAQ